MARRRANTPKSNAPKHYRLHAEMFYHPNYQALKPAARAVLTVVEMLHNGNNNGKIYVSCDTAARLAGVSHPTAHRALKLLEERRFIKCTKLSGFNMKDRQASEYALTNKPIGDAPATNAWQWWPADGPPPATPLKKNLRCKI